MTGLAPSITLAVPCRTDEPAPSRTLAEAWTQLGRPARAAGTIETLVCLNGLGASGSAALADLRALAIHHGQAPVVVDLDGAAPGLPPPEAGGLVVLSTRRAGKAIAWNLLRARARAATALFLDADVSLGPDAAPRLLAALARHPGAVLASPKTTCAPRPTAFERIMAAPYGVDFPNLSGQLYAARVAGLPPAMPEDLIEPERWLELAVGREHVVRDPAAHVVVRLPGTLADFYRQRIRIEMGKVQLAVEYPGLAPRGNPQPRLRAALAGLGAGDLVRLGLYLLLRESAHAVARRRYARRRTAGIWVQAASTKRWTT